jgi:hypothetical protein
MKRLRVSRPSPALVVSIIALVVAMGGTSYAAIKLPKNSVGSQQIKSNAVSSSKIKNGSLVSKDFRAGAVPAGRKGSTGASGAKGDKGSTGDTGPSNAYFTEGAQPVTVPAGDYVVFGEAGVDNTANGSASLETCFAIVTGSGATSTTPTSSGTAPAGGKVDIPVHATAHLPNGGTVSNACGAGGAVSFFGINTTAIRVGTLTP